MTIARLWLSLHAAPAGVTVGSGLRIVPIELPGERQPRWRGAAG